VVCGERVVAIVEYRDGTVIDMVRAVEPKTERTWPDNVSPDHG